MQEAAALRFDEGLQKAGVGTTRIGYPVEATQCRKQSPTRLTTC
jgi:hypothetical protein